MLIFFYPSLGYSNYWPLSIRFRYVGVSPRGMMSVLPTPDQWWVPFHTSLVSVQAYCLQKWCHQFGDIKMNFRYVGVPPRGMMSVLPTPDQWWVPFQCITSSTLHRVTTDRMHPLGIGVYWVDAPVHIIMTFTIYQNSILLHITQEMNIVLKSITLIFPL